MNRLERLHALSDRLRQASPGTISTRDLAADFEVSRRTIERAAITADPVEPRPIESVLGDVPFETRHPG